MQTNYTIHAEGYINPQYPNRVEQSVADISLGAKLQAFLAEEKWKKCLV